MFSYVQELTGAQDVVSRGNALETQRTERQTVEAAIFFHRRLVSAHAYEEPVALGCTPP